MLTAAVGSADLEAAVQAAVLEFSVSLVPQLIAAAQAHAAAQVAGLLQELDERERRAGEFASEAERRELEVAERERKLDDRERALAAAATAALGSGASCSGGRSPRSVSAASAANALYPSRGAAGARSPVAPPPAPAPASRQVHVPPTIFVPSSVPSASTVVMSGGSTPPRAMSALFTSAASVAAAEAVAAQGGLPLFTSAPQSAGSLPSSSRRPLYQEPMHGLVMLHQSQEPMQGEGRATPMSSASSLKDMFEQRAAAGGPATASQVRQEGPLRRRGAGSQSPSPVGVPKQRRSLEELLKADEQRQMML